MLFFQILNKRVCLIFWFDKNMRIYLFTHEIISATQRELMMNMFESKAKRLK
jgi:hypothetical protein